MLYFYIPAYYTFFFVSTRHDIHVVIYSDGTAVWFLHHKFWNKDSNQTSLSIRPHRKLILTQGQSIIKEHKKVFFHLLN